MALCGRKHSNDWRCSFADRGAKSPSVASESAAVRRPDLGLVSLDDREHARRAFESSINSLGISPVNAPAHARGYPAPITIRGPSRSARPTTSPA
jgi:hypothetical protein